MQASLAEERHKKQQLQAHANELTRQMASQQPVSSAPPRAGLRNATGEFNCFLNVIIQCLWYCSCFRTAVMAWPRAVYQVGWLLLILADTLPKNSFGSTSLCMLILCICSGNELLQLMSLYRWQHWPGLGRECVIVTSVSSRTYSLLVFGARLTGSAWY